MKNSNTKISNFKKKMNQSQVIPSKKMKIIKGGNIPYYVGYALGSMAYWFENEY